MVKERLERLSLYLFNKLGKFLISFVDCKMSRRRFFDMPGLSGVSRVQTLNTPKNLQAWYSNLENADLEFRFRFWTSIFLETFWFSKAPVSD